MSKRLQTVLIILGITFLAYSNSFDNTFQFDGIDYIQNNPDIRQFSHLKELWNAGHYSTRFVTFLSFALNYQLNQTDVFGYHLVNFLIHVGNALLVWWLIRFLFSLKVSIPERLQGQGESIALCTALIFAVHPIQTQAVTYIYQRSVLLATLFYLGSLCCYIKFRISLRKRWLVLFFVLGVLAMLSKEIAFTLPFMIVGFEFFFLREFKEKSFDKYQNAFLLGLGFLLLIIPLIFSFNFSIIFRQHASQSFDGDIISPLNYFLTQFRVMAQYFKLMIVPIGQNLDYHFTVSKSFWEYKTVLSFLLYLSVIIGGVLSYPKNKIVAFGIFWFFVTSSVESSIIPIRHVIFEHRMYLPSIGIFLVLVSSLFCFIENVKYRRIFLILWIILLCILTIGRNRVWDNPLSLWRDVAMKSPQKARPHNNLALAYVHANQYREALDEFDKAIELKPDYAKSYNNRGLLLARLQKFNEALADFSKAIFLRPYYVEAYNNRAMTFKNLSQYDKALNDYDQALLYDPNSAQVYINRGFVYEITKQYTEAMEDYNHAIELDSNNLNAYVNRAFIFIALKEYQKALNDFNFVVRSSEDKGFAYYQRSLGLFEMRQFEPAVLDYQKAQKIGFRIPQAYVEKIQPFLQR